MKSFLLGKKTEVKTLPYDAEIEYLESTGTQWIETGITVNSHTAIEIRVARTDATGYSYPSSLFEYVYDQSATRFQTKMSVIYNGINYFRSDIADKIGQVLRAGAANELHTYLIEQDGTVLHAEIDGTQVWSGTTTHDTWSSTDTAIMFGEKYNKAARSLANAIIASFKLKKDGAVAFDAIPVRVGQVGYMYDRVSGRLFGNSGTGDFILGPDKEVA